MGDKTITESYWLGPIVILRELHHFGRAKRKAMTVYSVSSAGKEEYKTAQRARIALHIWLTGRWSGARGES